MQIHVYISLPECAFPFFIFNTITIKIVDIWAKMMLS